MDTRLPLAALFACGTLFTASVQATGSEYQQAEFNAAYAQYQKLSRSGDIKASLPFAERAYDLGRKLYGDADRNTGALAVNYGNALLANGDRDKAREVLTPAVSIYEAIYGKDAPELIGPLMALGTASGTIRDPDPQEDVFDRALSIAEAYAGKESLLYGRLLLQAGTELFKLRDMATALTDLNQARDILETADGTTGQWTGLAEFELGRYFLYKNPKLSQAHLLKAVATFRDPNHAANDMEVHAHVMLVSLYERQGNHDAATPHCLAVGRATPFRSIKDSRRLFSVAPRYPEEELSQEHEAHVIVKFTIDAEGFARDAQVVETDGSQAFEEATLASVASARFAPRFDGDEAVPVPGVTDKYTFQIDDSPAARRDRQNVVILVRDHMQDLTGQWAGLAGMHPIPDRLNQ